MHPGNGRGGGSRIAGFTLLLKQVTYTKKIFCAELPSAFAEGVHLVVLFDPYYSGPYLRQPYAFPMNTHRVSK